MGVSGWEVALSQFISKDRPVQLLKVSHALAEANMILAHSSICSEATEFSNTRYRRMCTQGI